MGLRPPFHVLPSKKPMRLAATFLIFGLIPAHHATAETYGQNTSIASPHEAAGHAEHSTSKSVRGLTRHCLLVKAALSPHARMLHWIQRGTASWYGRELSSHRTSNGERFDRNAMTAAHRSLPFGTRLLVVDTRTRRSVVVRVNDRGPFTHRILDLSEAAARKLGIIRRGSAHIRIAIVKSWYRNARDETLEVASASEHASNEQALSVLKREERRNSKGKAEKP